MARRYIETFRWDAEASTRSDRYPATQVDRSADGIETGYQQAVSDDADK